MYDNKYDKKYDKKYDNNLSGGDRAVWKKQDHYSTELA